MNVADVLADSEKRLGDAGVANARMESASLIAFALDRDRTFLVAHPEYPLDEEELTRANELIARRMAREPFQYITGRQEFFGLDFEVSPDVLIPRPETEALVESALKLLGHRDHVRVCEIGIGSGCISISILKNVTTATALGVDISRPALNVANRNSRFHGVSDRLEMRLSNVYSAVDNTTFDLIVSNPPYVPLTDMATLQPEVRDFEPRSALTDGARGLSIIERIVTGAPNFLRSGGHLLIEFGFGQSESVLSMFDKRIWNDVQVFDDLQGIPRTISATLK